MKFYLGTHHATQRWFDLGHPLFVSRRVLTSRRTLPEARVDWALDSGGFTELSMYGEWRTTEDQYVSDLVHFHCEVGELEWAAPMDWMCEPFVLEKTGLTVMDHQKRTIENFRRLYDRVGDLVIPVLQGWTLDEYKSCWAGYDFVGVDLERFPLVGVGSVCRRQNTAEAGAILRQLHDWGLRLHGFGIKVSGLRSYSDCLKSADSMAWSYRARRSFPLPGCKHKSCSNCPRFAVRWREQVLNGLRQDRMEV